MVTKQRPLEKFEFLKMHHSVKNAYKRRQKNVFLTRIRVDRKDVDIKSIS